jgi:ABC-type transport system involved in multi-copper enzyme maturation permease subunit
MLAALIGRSLERARGLLLGLVVLLCGFQFLIVMIAREIQQSQAFTAITALIPAAFQQMAGGLSFGSYSGLASFGFVHPIVVLVLVEAAIFLASEPVWDVEARMVDLTMARPVPRWAAVARTLLVVFGATASVLLLMVVSTRLALRAFTPAGVPVPPLRTNLLLAINLMAVSWWFGSLSLLVASRARRRSAALGIAGLMAVFLYLLNLVTEIWAKARSFRFVTPFHYYNAPALIRGSNDAWPVDVAILLGATAVFCVAAWQGYTRRDL